MEKELEPTPPNLGNQMLQLLKKHFFAGVLIIIPMAVIALILQYLFSFLWSLRGVIPESWLPENFLENWALAGLFNILFVALLTLALALFVSGLGWSSKHYLGRKSLEFIAEAIQHIPVIRSVYSALDQLLKTMASGGGKQFNRVVYVEYPRKGTWVLAFVTGPARMHGHTGGALLNIYVPTTPNPTSGFHLIVEESEVRDAHMSVEEAFKTILSLGIANGGLAHGEGAGLIK